MGYNGHWNTNTEIDWDTKISVRMRQKLTSDRFTERENFVEREKLFRYTVLNQIYWNW